MNVVSRNVVTAFVSSLFVVVACTGVMMFFKIRLFSSEALHIWLGLAFVAFSCLHLLKNWRAFLGYFHKRSTWVSVLFSVFVVAVFIITPLLNPQEKGINPKAKIIGTMMSAPLTKVADFVDLDVELMVKALSDKQIVASGKQSVSEIAKANETSSDEILNTIFSTQKAP